MRPTLSFASAIHPQPLSRLLKLAQLLNFHTVQQDSMLFAARSSLRVTTRTGAAAALRFPRLEPLVRFQSTGASPDYTSILVSKPAEGVSQITLNRPKALNGPSPLSVSPLAPCVST